MDIKIRKVKREVTETTKVEHALVGNNLVVYKITDARVAVDEDGHKSRKRDVIQGFATEDKFKTWIPGRPSTYDTGFSVSLSLVAAGFREKVQQYGTPGGAFDDKWSHKDWSKITIDKPFDALKNGASIDNIVQVSFGQDGMLYDREGDVLPVAIVCNYMTNMYTDNSRYDLKKAVDILWDNPAVAFFSGNRNVDIIEDKNDVILGIEYYNSSPKSNHHLQFLWRPTVSECRGLWAMQLSYKGTYPSTDKGRAMFDLDVLGLRKGGAALYDDFYSSREYD